MKSENIEKVQRTLESLLSLLREIKTIKTFEVTASQDDINNNRFSFEVAGVIAYVQSEEVKDAIKALEALLCYYGIYNSISVDLYKDVTEWKTANKWDRLTPKDQIEKIYEIFKGLSLLKGLNLDIGSSYYYIMQKLERELNSDHIKLAKEINSIYYKGYVKQ